MLFHLSRIVSGFRSPLGSAANEETAKNLLEKYEEGNSLVWERQEDGSWIAMRDPYYYYKVDTGYVRQVELPLRRG